MSFALKLKTIREAKDISQPQLAKITGISQQSIAVYESGGSSPSWINIQLIAMALGVSCLDLTDDKSALIKSKKPNKKSK